MPVCIQAGFFVFMINKEDFIQLGVIAKPHGISGELQIRFSYEFKGIDINPSWLFLEIEGGLVPFEVLSLRSRGSDVLLTELDTITSEETARKYQNCAVFISPKEIPADNDSEEYELNTLIGYKVTDNKFGALGIIKSILDIKENPLMEIGYKEKDILVPLREEFITSIDKKAKTINIQTPDGLIELYLE